jgi:hypothetical protein
MARKAENGMTASNINQTYGKQGSSLLPVQPLSVILTDVKQVESFPV